MEFKLLGPVEACSDDGTVAVSPLSRSILAALLLQPNRTVLTGQLVVAVWGDSPPARAWTLVQNRVSELRRAFHDAQLADDLIITTGSGYKIQLEPDQIDTELFTRGVTRAAALVESGDPKGAVDELTAALALWRGMALDGLTTPHFRAAAKRLDEQRLRTWEQRIRLEVSLGRHADVIAELAGLTEGHPFHESFHALLMLALYWVGRHADALTVYHRARDTLVDQLGLEPSPRLQHLHGAILRSDGGAVQSIAQELGCSPALVIGADLERAAALRLEARSAVPRTLPADDAAFTGRTKQLAELTNALTASSDRVSPSVVIWVITGMAGVGKSTLAVRWAHQIADRFRDGQVYLDLRPVAGRPVTAAAALVTLLGALGIRPEQMPADVDDLAALYRSSVAGRRVLVLLDNASSDHQVRQLLPGGPDCGVVVTSRNRLSTLVAREGAHRLVLDVVQPEEAHILLARILGEDRLRAEPAATRELVRACGFLPLALRIVAAQLADRPHRSIAEHVTRLVGGDRLGALSIDHVDVRSAINESYVTLPSAAQKLFDRLGGSPSTEFTALAAAELAEVAVPEAERLLDRLAAEHLIKERGNGHYHLHDLLRLYAKERTHVPIVVGSKGAATPGIGVAPTWNRTGSWPARHEQGDTRPTTRHQE